MKTILIITTSFPKEADGREAAGSFVLDLATSISYDTKVIVLAPGESNNTIEKYNKNLIIHRYETPDKPLSELLKLSSAKAPFSIVSTIYHGLVSTNKLCKSYKIDHIISLWALPCGWWAKKAADKYNIPYSIWALGSDIWSLKDIPLLNRVLRYTLRSATNLFADGIQLSKDVNNITGNETCEFLPSARSAIIEPRDNINNTPPYTLCYVGRWHKNKGIDILLDALSLLSDRDWNNINKITIAGGGQLESEVKQKIQLMRNFQPKITLLGYTKKEQTYDLFRNSDFVLIPSRIESVPLVLTDAISSGARVISTPTGDLKSLIQTYDLGYISEEISAQSYSLTISNAISSDNHNNYFSKEYLKLFNLETVAARIKSL